MTECFFVSDLHGKIDRYQKLFLLIETEKPGAVFFGGDLLPHAMKKTAGYNDFALDYLFPEFEKLKQKMTNDYPEIFLILGNDDARSEEEKFVEAASSGLFQYINQKKVILKGFTVFGYCYVSPTPFRLKDWEKYDVSRYVDPGCSHPTEGFRTTEPNYDPHFSTIKDDLVELTLNENLEKAIFLFHSPPYQTNLDRAALDGKYIDHVPLDVHVGSIAIKRFIEEKQPLVTLHGHIHESARLIGKWMENIGKTLAVSASHDGKELSVIKFNPDDLQSISRLII